MKLLCLKSFPLAANGIDLVDVVAGEEHEIPDGLIVGLVDAGYIQAPEGMTWTPVVETPAASRIVETKIETVPEVKAEATPELEAEATPEGDVPELERLRAAYFEATQEQADKRWGLDTLREKLIEV